MKSRTMTEGASWKHILRFALPVLAGAVLQQLYNTVDAIIVGNFAGEASLSAIGTTGSFVFFFLAFAMGLSSGNGVVIAQHYGADDRKMVRENASTGMILLVGAGIIFAILGILIARPAYQFLIHVPADIIDKTVLYFRIYAVGLIFQFAYNSFAAILRSIGDSAATLYFLLIASLMNIGLDLLFVAVFHWDVAVAAVATVISQLASCIAAYLYMTKKYPIFRFKLREFTWNNMHALKTVKVGFPIALQLMIVSIGITAIQRAVNEFGQSMMASYTAGHRIEMYLGLPPNAFMTTMATYTGQNIGAGKMDRVRTGVWQSVLFSFSMTLVFSAIVFFFSNSIAGLFGLSDQALEYCRAHLQTIAFINIILSLYIPLFGLFQGANHSGFPTIVASVALGVRVLVTYLFRYSDFLGYSVIWWNGVFGFSMGFLVSWIYYLSGRWKKNVSLR